MRTYTTTHLWLQPDPVSGRLWVGITERGDEAMGGIVYLDVDEGANTITVEGRKSVLEVVPPVRGKIDETNTPDWRPTIPVVCYEPGWELTERTMTQEEYDDYDD